MPRLEEPVLRDGLAVARSLYLGVLGAVLGVALVVGLTDALGRRACEVGAGAVPGAAALFGCGR
jgi:hypothetical protein